MSETTEQPTITAEMVAAYQQQQQAEELRKQEACIKALIALAAEHGYEIGALPVQVEDGRSEVISLGAKWGLRRKQ